MTTTDPFAPPVSGGSTLTTASTISPWESSPEPKTSGITVDVKPRILDPELAHSITTTYKGGSGFDAPWVVTRANSIKEADALLDQEFKDYLAKVKRVAEHFSGGSLAPARGGNTSGASAPPQGATEAPSWAPARHQPDAVYKTGVSKAGKTWHAWMSPEKGQYEPKFFYKD